MKKNSCAAHIRHFLSEMFLSPLPLLHKEHRRLCSTLWYSHPESVHSSLLIHSNRWQFNWKLEGGVTVKIKHHSLADRRFYWIITLIF